MLWSRLAAFMLFGGAACAGVEDFYGHWENPARDEGGLTHIVISPDGGNRVNVRAYGDCHPVECNWGLVQGKSYTTHPKSDEVDRIAVTFNAGLARRQIIFRVAEKGRLGFEMLVEYPEGAGRHDFTVRGTLRPTAWAGPIAENWERPAGSGSGWGGGARSGVSPAPKEICLTFNSAAVRLVQKDGQWRVMGGPEILAASAEKRLAQRAESTIRYYHFDRRCAVGGTTYWKEGASVPARKMGGADCLGFNRTTVHVARIGNGWKVVDGTRWIADLGPHKDKAKELLSLIRTHRLSARCVVGWPNPTMMYWLAL